MRKLLYILIAIPNIGIASEIHTEWYACQKDSDCVIVRANCGVAWAANKEFVEQTRKEKGEYYCLQPIEYHPDNTVAKCENNKCVLDPK